MIGGPRTGVQGVGGDKIQRSVEEGVPPPKREEGVFVKGSPARRGRGFERKRDSIASLAR